MEGVTALVFFLAEEGTGTNAFNKKLEAFIHCINVGCGDGEEVGDRRKVGDVAKGLGRAFDEVGQPGVEEGVLHRELVFVMLLGGLWGEKCKAVILYDTRPQPLHHSFTIHHLHHVPS